MPRQTPSIPLLAGAALAYAAALAGPTTPKPILYPTRQSDSDLQVTGLIQGQHGFLRYADLLHLPQTRVTITDNPDYPGTLHVAGVSFETLSHALGAAPQADLLEADCADRYRAHFPAEYIAQHHPILVLTIDNKPLTRWAKEARQYDPSPYVVMYPHFVPAFQVLAHRDQQQLPDNVVSLRFTTQASTFGPLAPRGNFAPNSPEQADFTIARQNCLRCHFLRSAGGTKSGVGWAQIAVWAREQPRFFAAWVHDPTRIEPHSRMPANPTYDQPTLAALTAYFRTFDTSSKAAAQ